MAKRVSIYIDGANFVYGMKSLNPKYSDYHFDFENYIKAIVGKDELVEVFYYNASLKQEVNQLCVSKDKLSEAQSKNSYYWV